MVITFPLATALSMADKVGLPLRRCDRQNANLYAWCTPLDEVLYFGKATSQKRHDEEFAWRNEDPAVGVRSAFADLTRENNAEQRFLYTAGEPGFDRDAARNAMQAVDWGDSSKVHDLALKWLALEDEPLADWMVEKFLIRSAVRYGAPIGNSQHGSQWETPIGRAMDTLAFTAIRHLRHGR